MIPVTVVWMNGESRIWSDESVDLKQGDYRDLRIKLGSFDDLVEVVKNRNCRDEKVIEGLVCKDLRRRRWRSWERLIWLGNDSAFFIDSHLVANYFIQDQRDLRGCLKTFFVKFKVDLIFLLLIQRSREHLIHIFFLKNSMFLMDIKWNWVGNKTLLHLEKMKKRRERKQLLYLGNYGTCIRGKNRSLMFK